MQIVIDIPEWKYKSICEGVEASKKCGVVGTDSCVHKAIYNGIPLPKGHGRLIDADELISNICGSSCGCHLEECGNDNPCYSVTRISSAQTVIEADKSESEKGQPKQTDDSCLNFYFDKVKEILKKDDFDDLVVDHTCEEKQEQTRDEKMIDAIDFAIKATGSRDDYSLGMCNGMRYVKYLIDGKEPQYEVRQTDEEIKLGIDLGDEVVGDYGAKGVVVGIDTHKDEVVLSLLMGNHKVPQIVKASSYKTKTGRHFPQIIEVLKQIKGEADGK